MSGASYHLVFRGEVLEGQDRTAVARRLAALLKLDAPKVRALFSGKPVVLKRNVPKDVAVRYQAAFRDAGARLRVTSAGQASTQSDDAGSGHPGSGRPRSADAGSGRPRSADAGSAQAEASTRKPSLAERLAAQEAAAQSESSQAVSGRPIQATLPPDLEAGDDLSVAPAEGDLVRSEERPVIPTVAVDVSHLSAAPPNSGSFADVLPPSPSPPPAPDTSHLELDAVGIDLSPPRQLTELKLDLSALTLAEPGADLAADRREAPPVPVPEPEFDLAPPGSDLETLPKDEPPPPPNVSHLKLE